MQPFFFIGLFSCKSVPKTEYKIELERTGQKDSFLGVYFAEFPTKKNGISVYSVEFKADKSARVLLFRHEEKPTIIHGKWLTAEDGIIILYFPNNTPSEFFLQNEDGSLSFLDGNKKTYAGSVKDILTLRKLRQ